MSQTPKLGRSCQNWPILDIDPELGWFAGNRPSSQIRSVSPHIGRNPRRIGRGVARNWLKSLQKWLGGGRLNLAEIAPDLAEFEGSWPKSFRTPERFRRRAPRNKLTGEHALAGAARRGEHEKPNLWAILQQPPQGNSGRLGVG